LAVAVCRGFFLPDWSRLKFNEPPELAQAFKDVVEHFGFDGEDHYLDAMEDGKDPFVEWRKEHSG